MPYDRDSFLAGVAAGRNMRSWPAEEYADTTSFRFTLWIDAQETTRSFQFPVSMIGKISWGDGDETEVSSAGVLYRSHTYSTDGIFSVTLVGKIYSVSFGLTNNTSDLSPYCLMTVDTPIPPLPDDATRPAKISLYRMFARCHNLIGVPPNLFKNYVFDDISLVRVAYMFYQCTSLYTLSPELFSLVHFGGSDSDNDKSAASMFRQCSAMYEVPDGLLSNPEFSYFTDTNSIFRACSSLRRLYDGIFDAWTGSTSFANGFDGCTSLVSLPDRLFAGLSAVESFADCFRSCGQLQDTGDDIFYGCTGATTFERTFYYCDLSSINPGMFDDCPNVTTFSNVFYRNRHIVTIPEGLFDNCTLVTSFAAAFGVTGVSAIPPGLFDSCTLVERFTETFSQTSITSIPEGLFDNCPLVVSFGTTFFRTPITGIPIDLFDNCPNVTNFYQTFEDCTRVVSAVPELWVMYPNADHIKCFRSCNRALNWSDIPNGWK